ncbi:hypothetical protein BDK92_7492 [Micromonospora pisi]|uniref:Uncharacterized protein n=1 Tax=Micromonospora pisi TaxID=589240 RepID=A0A495JWR0_9ACTN|nr:hypothetical protein [Micromonospora pisi]RKR92995.1 hypothetical protein BDK92_7492 [Micromonospora pisi]
MRGQPARLILTAPRAPHARLAIGWRAWEPGYAEFLADEQEPVGIGFTRFQAQIHAWRHQATHRGDLLPEQEATCLVF